MWRFLAGVGSTLLLAGAGLVWWTSGRPESPLARAVAPPLAAPASHTETPPPAAEERTREEKRFDRYDKDRDQSITAEEYLASRRKAYAKLDANGDGRLSFDEWAKKTTDKFAGADADKSRALSREEFTTTRVVRKAKAPCPPAPARQDDEG
jgi:hypothetical protein